MPLAARTRWLLCRYWGENLGVDPGAFETSGVSVGATDREDVDLFVRGDAVLVGAPSPVASDCDRAAERLSGLAPDDADTVRNWFEEVASPERVLGPAFYGYADATTFDPVDDESWVLDGDDASPFETLRAAVPDEEWANGGPEFRPGETVGRFVDGDLVAVAGYDVWDDLIAHVAVVTHPDHRSAGNGRAAVSLVTERALDAGLLPQYRTADAWPWSVALAEGLGYERFATSYLAVREP